MRDTLKTTVTYGVVFILVAYFIVFIAGDRTNNYDEKMKQFAENCLHHELKSSGLEVGEYTFTNYKPTFNGRPFKQLGNVTFKGEKYFCEAMIYDEIHEKTCAINCWTNLKK